MASGAHKHPNYMAIFWYLAVLTVIEIAVIYMPLAKLTIGVLLCGLALGKAKMFLFFTALGGATFVSLQAYEWTHLIHRGLHVNGNPWGATLFGTSFFIITGFHGLHVTAGVIYLLSIIGVVNRRPDPAASYNVVEIAGLYWHFVDLVWIMVFTFMYLL